MSENRRKCIDVVFVECVSFSTTLCESRMRGLWVDRYTPPTAANLTSSKPLPAPMHPSVCLCEQGESKWGVLRGMYKKGQSVATWNKSLSKLKKCECKKKPLVHHFSFIKASIKTTFFFTKATKIWFWEKQQKLNWQRTRQWQSLFGDLQSGTVRHRTPPGCYISCIFVNT